jgi:hypothetical protein
VFFSTKRSTGSRARWTFQSLITISSLKIVGERGDGGGGGVGREENFFEQTIFH